ncbi:MAG TPA: hypothetical protein VMN82_13375 [Thermoanaerobaculia bacterium]|nr:hypothetical protein [Thermoanaerobaculia bacterium]
MSSPRRSRWLPAAVLTALLAPRALAQDGTGEIARSIEAERARLDLPPMQASPPLAHLAAELAAEIGAGTTLEFEPIGGVELLRRARSLGYAGLGVQQLTAVDDRSACEIVEAWNERLPGSEVYRRPEATEIGVAFGFVQDLPLTVVVVGVPVSADPLRKKWPGVAPREHLEADLFREVNDRRFRLGRPLFLRSARLDAEAQNAADAILWDVAKDGAGLVEDARGQTLYFKGAGLHGTDPGYAIDQWLHAYRSTFVGLERASAGVGIASRGQQGRLEAVWVLLVQPAGSAQQ